MVVTCFVNIMLSSAASDRHPSPRITMPVRKKNAYELSRSQVNTPAEVVALFWKLVHEARPRLGNVLDFGAGDCRFANGGTFRHYIGIELDGARSAKADLPANGKLSHGCAFQHVEGEYDACIGNPPYVRHHDVESPWKENTVARLGAELGISLNGHCNLYLYFFVSAYSRRTLLAL